MWVSRTSSPISAVTRAPVCRRQRSWLVTGSCATVCVRAGDLRAPDRLPVTPGRHLVRTLADLAAQQGVGTHSYLIAKRHLVDGFPAPISSAGSRTRLYGGEQVDAFLAGQPVPDLPTEDDHQDLLDRRECAAALGISPRTWDKYKTTYPILAEHKVTIAGVGHWPRHILHQQQTKKAAKVTAPPGRPTRSGDQVPRDQLLPLTAPLLDADPTISAARVTEELGMHRDTAQDALLRLRADRIAHLMLTDPSLTPDQSAAALGYPAGQVRRATVRAQTVLRAHRAAPYLADVARALQQAGWATTATVPDIQRPPTRSN